MKKKVVSGIILTLLFIGMLTIAFNILLVKASGIIYIRADGSVDPPTANITSVDNVTYSFTDNNYYGIVVERDNIVVDGADYTLQGTGSGEGVTLSGRSNVTIKNMKIKAFETGIYLESSSGNTISGNNMTNNKWGIYLWISSNNVLRNNSMTNNEFNYVVEGEDPSDYVNDVDSSNTVDGKPIYYWISKQDMAIPLDAGYVALVYCTNITVRNLKNSQGVVLVSTQNSVITQNTITDNYYGIECGPWSSNYNTISGNNITNNTYGVHLWDSCNNNTISGNNITNNKYGVYLDQSSNNTISGNNITNNTYGVHLWDSCNNNTISGNNITNNWSGILLYRSFANTISGNNITNNYIGVYLYGDSSNNRLFHNNFIVNTMQVYYSIHGYANVWDEGYPSGGNYWSDYFSFDLYSGPYQNETGSDGIGDTSYVINNDDIDHYPLISPFPQTPDFDIVVSPSTGTTAQGTTVTTDVYVSAIAGYDYLVSLSASGQPEGVTIDFNPNTGTPYFTSTMTIQVGDSVPANTYSITVTGLGSDDTTHSTTYVLTVTETYDLTITTTTGGTTNPTPGIHTYDDGEVAVVSAIPYTDYLFDHWELDGNNVGATNPISVTMDSDHTLHAAFFYTGPGIPEYPGADISIVAATFGFLAALYFTLKRKKQARPTASVTSSSKA